MWKTLIIIMVAMITRHHCETDPPTKVAPLCPPLPSDCGNRCNVGNATRAATTTGAATWRG